MVSLLTDTFLYTLADSFCRGKSKQLTTLEFNMLTPCSGLDSRYMISELKPQGVEVLSLTTIATPHHGSAFADYLFKRIGAANIPKLYKALEAFGFETGAFEQLTNKYMQVGIVAHSSRSGDPGH